MRDLVKVFGEIKPDDIYLSFYLQLLSSHGLSR